MSSRIADLLINTNVGEENLVGVKFKSETGSLVTPKTPITLQRTNNDQQQSPTLDPNVATDGGASRSRSRSPTKLDASILKKPELRECAGMSKAFKTVGEALAGKLF